MNILCVLSLFASLLKYRLVIICMNVLVCVMAAKCRHPFSVLTSGPVTVGGQRGTCGGPDCFDNYFTYFVPVFKYCYHDSRNL